MNHRGIWDGDEVTVIVYQNKERIGEITILAISHAEITAQVYTDNENTLISLYEGVSAALSAIKYHTERPKLREMIEERIAELKAGYEDGEEDDPPAPSTVDLPF